MRAWRNFIRPVSCVPATGALIPAPRQAKELLAECQAYVKAEGLDRDQQKGRDQDKKRDKSRDTERDASGVRIRFGTLTKGEGDAPH